MSEEIGEWGLSERGGKKRREGRRGIKRKGEENFPFYKSILRNLSVLTG